MCWIPATGTRRGCGICAALFEGMQAGLPSVCMQALPFVIKIEKHRRYKAEVEERLAEIEEAWQMFSQPQVLVEL